MRRNLVRRNLARRNYGEMDWILPGVQTEENEPIQEAAARECLKETGSEVNSGALVALASRPHTENVFILLSAEISGQSARQPDRKIAEIGFFFGRKSAGPHEAGRQASLSAKACPKIPPIL